MNQATRNGGFPLPAAGDPERLVESSHAGCAGRTRVRLPAALPTRAVRRVICDQCSEPFDAAEVIEVQRERKRLGLPLSLPVGALAVFAALSLVRGDEPVSQGVPAGEARNETQAEPAALDKGRTTAAKAAAEGTTKTPLVPADAQVVADSTFSLALPPGWDRVAPAAGATFAAVSPDSTADATLWIQSDPTLDMATFEANSLKQLEVLTGSAEVVDRKLGPTLASSSVTLAPKKAPAGAPAVEVTLRGSGANWFYLMTTIQPSAGAEAVAGAELIQGSFVAQGGKG